MCVVACVCVCIFHTFYHINLYFHCVAERREQEVSEGLWVCAKTVIKDRDCERLCENVFMCVCMGAPTGTLSWGLGF